MSKSELLAQIKQLKESDQYDEMAAETFIQWERSLEEIMAKESLLDHFVIKELLDLARTKVVAINRRLLTERSSKLPEVARDMVMAERGFWEYLVGLFTGHAKDLKTITQQVEDEVKELKNNE